MKSILFLFVCLVFGIIAGALTPPYFGAWKILIRNIIIACIIVTVVHIILFN